MRYTIKLSYLGADFFGWQIQPDFRSVQEEVQKALSTLLRCEIAVTGAGRTDTGVNGINYLAHFDLPENLAFEPEATSYKLNAMLPKGIRVHEIREAAPDFHARFDATSREYRYFIHRTKDPFMDNFSHLCRYPLDLDKMNEACRLLLGTHDFSCFEKTGGNNKTSVCTIQEALWETYTPTHVSLLGYPCREEDYIMFKIKADRFLRNMVRAIVGTMVDIGRGRHEPEWITGLIRSGNRSEAGESVPGKALFFIRAGYPEEQKDI